jgi:hypothetical protein
MQPFGLLGEDLPEKKVFADAKKFFGLMAGPS